MTAPFHLDMNELLGENINIHLRGGKTLKRPIHSYKQQVRHSCQSCMLRKDILTPQMEPWGKFKKGVMLIGEGPGKVEDKKGRPFCGKFGSLLTHTIEDLDLEEPINVKNDCLLSNVVQCYLKNNKFPSDSFAYSCFKNRLEKQILKHKPKLIIAVGFQTAKYILDFPIIKDSKGKSFKWNIDLLRGKLIPSPKYKCWVGCIWHPAFILRNPDYEDIFERDLKYIFENGFDQKELEYRLSLPNTLKKNCSIVTSFKDAKRALDDIIKDTTIGTRIIDFETTKLNVFDLKTKVLTLAAAKHVDKAVCIPYDFPPDPELGWKGWTKKQRQIIRRKFKQFFISSQQKGAHNKKFENNLIQSKFKIRPTNLVYDSMHSAHALDGGRKGSTKLDIQVFFLTGTIYSDAVDHNNLVEMPLKDVGLYNCLDVKYPLILKEKQEIITTPSQGFGISLINAGANLFSNMECRGIKIDLEEVEKQKYEVSKRLVQYDKEIQEFDFVRKFKKRRGFDLNYGSTQQLSDLFFNQLKLSAVGKTKKGNYSLDEENLIKLQDICHSQEIDHFINNIVQIRKLGKYQETYLENWLSNLDSYGLLHPSYWILTDTYRSNSENPNFQNIPSHDPFMRQVRRCIVPHLGDYFLECDYGAMEVRVIAMYSQDPVLIKWIKNDVDFHRKYAAKIFGKKEENVTKEERFYAKNNMVFALFYGSYYKSIYKSFQKLGYKDIPERHFQRIEKEFWWELRVTKAWQQSVERFYQRYGYVELKTGFRRYGPLNRNQLYNTPIQGTAFHFLLAGLIEVDKIMIAEKMKSGIEIQVHDSSTVDIVDDEMEQVYELTEKELNKKRFKFQNVPLKLEWSLGENWLDMKEIKLAT